MSEVLRVSAVDQIPLGIPRAGLVPLRLRGRNRAGLIVASRPAVPIDLRSAGTVPLEIQHGSGPSGAPAKSSLVDPGRPIAYVGYPGSIRRLDYSSWPPRITRASVDDLITAWPQRASLTYT